MTIRILILLLLPCFVQAQTWSFRQYTAEQGLPSTEVYDILQDRSGYIWVATDRGVARFDGYTFESFTTAEGLSNNVVFRLYEGPDGKIWFAELSGTLSYYEQGRIYPAAENGSILAYARQINFPRSLSVGKDHIDVGYTGCGMLRLQNGSVSELYAGQGIRDIVTVTDNTALFGTRKGRGPTLVDYYGRHYFYQEDRIHSSYRIDALKRRNDDLLVTVSGVVRVFNRTGETKCYTTRDVTACCETWDSSLYALTWNGFFRYGPHEAFAPGKGYRHLEGCRINRVIMDREGGLWVATLNKGVFYCAHPGFMVHRFSGADPGEGKPAYSVCGDRKGKTFVCLEGGAIYYLDRDKPPVCIFPKNHNILNAHIRYDTVNDYLLTGRYDAIVPSYRKKIRYLPVATGNGSVPYKGGYLWGDFHTLGRYLPASINQYGSSVPGSPGEPGIQCMFRLSDDSIYLGTLNGLYRYHDSVWQPMLSGTGFASERINDIECLNRRLLVLSTIGKGLLLYDLYTGKLQQINHAGGLVSDVINDADQAPDGSLWLGTNKGLSHLTVIPGGGYRITNYTTDNGIPAADIKRVYADSHKVYLGTHAGLVLFDPRRTTIDHDPEIWFRSASVNGKAIASAMLTRLRSGENNLRISYLSIIPKMQGKVLYRYRLQGARNAGSWVYVREPQLFLSSLEPGNYQLIIQACNSAGQWSKTPLILPISIAAPFWKTWWFIAGSITMVAIALILIQQARMKSLRSRTANEKLSRDYQQQALMNQINPHFLFNSMNSIQKYILREDKERAVSFVSKFAKLIRTGLEHSREPLVPLNKELELLHIYMLLEQERFRNKITYDVILQPGLETQQLLVPPMLIQPFLENAVRHGLLHREAGGTIILRLRREDQLLYCEVEDDGVGRKRAMELSGAQPGAHRPLALHINTQRLQLLAHSLNSRYLFEVTDKTDKEGNATGTLIKFIIPYRYEY